MNISGNYETTDREVEIVKRIFDLHNIKYQDIQKYDIANDGDVLVVLDDGRDILIEVKEESFARFPRYGDLGIDFISAFYFNNPSDEYGWKGSPKQPGRLQEFLSAITVKKAGKLKYSKSDLWLFFVENPEGGLYYSAFFDGSFMTSREFRNYLCRNCLFAVNNKPASQMSHSDSHHSACFFIKHNDPFLNQHKIDLCEYIEKA